MGKHIIKIYKVFKIVELDDNNIYTVWHNDAGQMTVFNVFNVCICEFNGVSFVSH